MASVMESIKKKKQEIASKTNRTKSAKPLPGKNRYRLLPTWRKEADGPVFVEDGKHFIKDIDPATGKEKIQAVYNCDAIVNGTACDVCDALAAAAHSADIDDSTLNLLEEAKARGVILFNALHVTGPDPLVPIVLALTMTTADQVFSMIIEYDDAGVDMLSLTAGIDLIIDKTGSGFETRYSVIAAPKSAPVDASVMKSINDLDAFVAETDEARVKALSAISVVSGVPAIGRSASAGALTDGTKKPTAEDMDIDDEVPDFDVEKLAESAAKVEAEIKTATDDTPELKPTPDELAGVSEDDILIHDVTNAGLAAQLALLEFPDAPYPIGIFRQVNEPVYGEWAE